MPDSVLSVSSRALLMACDRLGLDTEAILSSTGVSRKVIDDPDGRLAVGQVRALWAAAVAQSGDPDLALHAAEALPFGAYKVIDHLAASAPTIGRALHSVSTYFPLINTAVELPIEIGDDQVSFGARAPHNPAALTRAYAEYTFAAVYLRTRDAAGVPFPLLGVELSHAAPPKTSEHERVFGCPVRFDQPRCRMIVARSVWDMPTASAEPLLFQVLDEHASLLLERVPSRTGFAADVRAAIARELSGGDAGLDNVARQLAMSPRTLQRRLGELEVSYSDLVDETRRGLCMTYLSDSDVSLGEVAYLLGFSGQSSFTRAFKRWTGNTPTEYRRTLVTT